MFQKVIAKLVVKALVITGSFEWEINGHKYIVGTEDIGGHKVLCLFED